LSALLTLYHRLPPQARNLAASLRGYYLKSWRYGPETDRLVEEALERERWSPEQWKAWQEERLAFVLHRAATRVPFYRHQWDERRRKGDRASWDLLENWPVLGKEPLRANPRAFVAEDCDIRRMYHNHTSGTTGKPLDLWWSRETVRGWYALFEARWRRWYGVSRHDRWAILGGQLVTPVTQRKPPFWVWNQALNQLYMSTFHLSRKVIPYYLEALSKHKIKYVYGYTSSLNVLAQEIIRSGYTCPPLAVVLTNAEPLFEHQRRAISQAFGCPVRETYGMGEIVIGASECGEGHLHLWPEVGWVEIFRDSEDTPVSNGEIGRLVSTSLLNADMPLVRYAVGDRSAGVQSHEPTDCGCNLPLLAKIEGRSNDLLVTPDGRPIYWLNPVFYGMPVEEAQIIQESLDQIRVRYVPAVGFSREDARSIMTRLQQRMGNVEVVLEEVSEIPREANGKFRAVVCKLSDAERSRVQ